MELFQATVRYERTEANGLQKKVNETYLTDALSFTECESIMVNQMGTVCNGEFSVTSIKQVRCDDFICAKHKLTDGTVEYDFDYNADASKYFEVKIRFGVIDEKSGETKFSFSTFIVVAENLEDAKDRFHSFMHGTMLDYELVSVKETKIVGFIPHYLINE